MKKTTWVAIGLVIVLIVAIGVGAYYLTRPEEEEIPTEEFRVALILFGAALDGSWNEFWYEGAHEIELLHPEITVTVSEWVYTADYARVAGGYAAQGYDLIVATTPEYQTPALTIAPDYPDTMTVIQGGWLNASNVGPINIWPNEGSYLAGMLAAYMSNTSKIGVIGSFTYPSQISAHEGFMAGARAVNPTIDIRETFTESWIDTALGRSAAIAMMDAGVDDIYFTTSGMALGGIPACKERGKLAIGAFLDMNSIAPKTVITSVMWKSAGPIMKVIDEIRAGTFDPVTEDHVFFMKDGAVDIAPYHFFEDKIPTDVKAEIAAAREAIINGTLTVPLVKSR